MRVGVDAGGTSTRAVLVDQTGRCLGYGTAGGGNPVSWGAEQASRAVGQAVAGALAQAGVRVPCDVGVVALAMAGGNSAPSLVEMQAELAALGLTGTVSAESDLLATFCAGTAALAGYAVVAGTGAAAIRVRDGDTDACADGLGWLLGDEGSGFWIGHRVARAALAALDDRGPATTLADLMLGELGITDDGGRIVGRRTALAAAIQRLYAERPVQLSRLAVLAFRAAGVTADGSAVGGPDSGADPDPVAVAILDAARAHLVDTVRAVHRPDLAGPVVIGGGIARRLPGLAEAIAGDLGPAPGRAAAVVTVTDGAVGAGVIALRRAGVTVGEAVFERLVASVADRRTRREPTGPAVAGAAGM